MRNEQCVRKSKCYDYKHNHCDGCGGNNPKGDLISRSALKEHKFLSPDNPNATRWSDEKVKAYQKGWNDCIDAIIDNAPTVNPEKPIFSEVWYQERPQGECQNCDFKKFSERMIDVIIDNADGIIEELERRVRGEEE